MRSEKFVVTASSSTEPIFAQSSSLDTKTETHHRSGMDPYEGKLSYFLSPQTTWLQFGFYLFTVFATIAVLVFTASMQSGFLMRMFGVVESRLGNTTGSITFIDQIVSLLLLGVWGVLSEKIGRGSVYGVGFAMMGGGLIWMGYSRTVFPEMALGRALFAVGGAATTAMLTAVLADMLGERHRGKASGLVGTCSGLGAVFSAFFLLKIPKYIPGDAMGGKPIKAAYVYVGSVTIALGAIVTLALTYKPKKRRQNLASGTTTTSMVPENTMEKENSFFWTRVWGGAKLVRNPKVALAFLGGFVARADTVILSVFVWAWVEQYLRANNLCEGGRMCHNAFEIAGRITGVAHAVALACAPLVGIAIDYLPTYVPMLVSAAFGVAGYLWFTLISDPRSRLMMAAAALVGVAEIGMVVSSLALVTGKYVGSKQRGMIAGCYSVCGTLGLLISTKLGGHLMDQWIKQAPFFLLFVYNATAFIACAAVALNEKVRRKQ